MKNRICSRWLLRTTVLAVGFTTCGIYPSVAAFAQSATVEKSGYQLPPQEVVDIIDAPATPSVRFSPDAQWMLMVERESMPSIADVSRRMLRLAGMRIDPVANARHSNSFQKGLSLRHRDGLETWTIAVADGAKITTTS